MKVRRNKQSVCLAFAAGICLVLSLLWYHRSAKWRHVELCDLLPGHLLEVLIILATSNRADHMLKIAKGEFMLSKPGVRVAAVVPSYEIARRGIDCSSVVSQSL